MNKRSIGCAAVVAVIAILALVLALLRPSLFSAGERTIDSDIVGAQFNDIAELATEEYVYSSVGKFDDEGLRLLGVRVPFTGKHFLVTYEGRVTAGIREADDISVDVDEERGVVNVSLPDVEVLDSTVKSGSAEVWDQSMNPVNQIRVNDVTEFIHSREELEKQKAIDSGLLDRARAQAERLLVNHIEALSRGTNLEGYDVEVAWR